MNQQEEAVFVITGGAGGMGRACARRLGKRGLLLLADVVADPLEQAAHQLRAEGFRVETQRYDVSQGESVQALAEIQVVWQRADRSLVVRNFLEVVKAHRHAERVALSTPDL